MKPTEKKDVGMRVIEEVIDNLTGVSGEMSLLERGFVFESDGIIQTVWAQKPEMDRDELASRIYVETPFLKDFPSSLGRDTSFAHSYNQATFFGPYRKEGDDTIFLRSSVMVSDHNQALILPIVLNAMTAQLTEVFSYALPFCQFLNCTQAFPGAGFNHPGAGKRRFLTVAEPRIEPAGRPWNGRGIYDFLSQKIRCDGGTSRIWSTGMAARFPVVPSKEGKVKDSDRMFFIVSGNPIHPLWGSGIFFMLELPHRFSPKKLGENVFDLNRFEQETPPRSHYLGSWCVNQKNLPAFVSFIPWFLCSENILLDQLFSALERITWINSMEFY